MKVPQDPIDEAEDPHCVHNGPASPSEWGSLDAPIESWGTFMQRGRSW